MNLPFYSTKLNKKLQQLSRTWEQEILSHLPENLDSIAQNSGIIKRKRGISDISDTAWRKKCKKATSFLQDILQQLLSSLFPLSCITPKNKQVLLVDASLIRQ